ncbi:MAG: LysM peptidoglycan-binding domain-containing protein [Clostridium sp.]|nr:MAG: LysM peptidoglycan-binding domain-containing protein [Clostridium sp.]
MTVSELKELNKLSTNNLKIGQTLKIAKKMMKKILMNI